ncbi:hypothetical protein ACWGR4_46535 [Embleya sp. NPDC055664]|uniref:hypothetical protein n=1 Tax=Embleya sp. NPDC059237 TaxID=3346784 RepID=UPI003695B676
MHILRAVESKDTRWWHAVAHFRTAACGVGLPDHTTAAVDDALSDLLCPACMSAIGGKSAVTTGERPTPDIAPTD